MMKGKSRGKVVIFPSSSTLSSLVQVKSWNTNGIQFFCTTSNCGSRTYFYLNGGFFFFLNCQLWRRKFPELSYPTRDHVNAFSLSVTVELLLLFLLMLFSSNVCDIIECCCAVIREHLLFRPQCFDHSKFPTRFS